MHDSISRSVGMALTIIALILVTFGVGLLTATHFESQVTTIIKPVGATAQATTVACEPGNDLRTSDLCAQWKAADAAADSAWWAWVSGLVGFASLLGVGGALWLAFHSNSIARDTAKRQLRAYLAIDAAEVRSDGNVPPYRLWLDLVWKNSGATPAYKVETYVEFVVADRGWRGVNTFAPPETRTVTSIAPDGKLNALNVEINLTERDRWRAGERDIFVYCKAMYVDVFGEPHRTEYRLVVKGDVRLELSQEDIGNDAT